MQPASRFDSPHWELVNAILIAVVSIATAFLQFGVGQTLSPSAYGWRSRASAATSSLCA
jgi:hypothetical protein